MYDIRGIQSSQVPEVWNWAEPHIAKALKHSNSEYSADDLKARCASADCQLWLILGESGVIGAGTTAIVELLQKRICFIGVLAGADFDEWKNLALMQIQDWAKANGCEAIQTLARKGFEPKLRDMGFGCRQVVMWKELKRGKAS
jgi:hypothetical protein